MGTLGHMCGDFGLVEAREGTQGRMRCGNVWDAGTSNIRDARGKVGGKCDISSFMKMCYLWSTLDSIVQNQIRHLTMFTKVH